MSETLRTYFECRFPITDEEFDFIKGELFLREGEVAKYAVFVAKGCLRNYVIDNKGKEHIVQFAPENWWLADSDSLKNGIPTIYFIDAIEDSDILLLDGPSH